MSERMIFGIGGLVIGGAVGFIIGYTVMKKKVSKDSAEKLNREVEQVHADDAAHAEEMAKQKEHYEQLLADMRYQAEEEEEPQHYEDEDLEEESSDENDMEDAEDIHTDDVDIEKEPPKKHKKPKVLGINKFDVDEPDTDYQDKDIYYFMQSELMTDDNGNPINETDTIGNRLRQTGYMNGNGSLNDVWVRNYDREIDYCVHRMFCAVEDQFTTEEQNE